MALGNPFQPSQLGTIAVSVGVASSFTAIPPTTGGNQPAAFGGECLELQSPTSNTGIIFVESCGGGNPQIAATVANSYPVLPGQSKVISVTLTGDGGIAAISTVAAQTLYVSRGNGI